MKTKTVIATFKGQDLSCGYRTGQLYELLLTEEKEGFSIRHTFGCPDCSYCLYESVFAFLNNWTNIKSWT